MIISAVGLLAGNAKPTREEIVRGMNGNICRCGTYSRIVAAIQRAAGESGTKAAIPGMSERSGGSR